MRYLLGIILLINTSLNAVQTLSLPETKSQQTQQQTQLQQNPTTGNPQSASSLQQPGQFNLSPDLENARNAGQSWLTLIDNKNYNSSWDQASKTLQILVDKNGWNTAMTKLRQPLGAVDKRTLKDVRTATNPPGAPAGDYVVLVYDTDFSGRKSASELVILIKESSGNWKVMSYYAR